MSIISKLLKQCRKPNELFCRMVANGMNRSHAAMTKWVLEQIGLTENMLFWMLVVVEVELSAGLLSKFRRPLLILIRIKYSSVIKKGCSLHMNSPSDS